MATITYALASAGVYGLMNGNYVDLLAMIVDGFEDGDLSEYTINRQDAAGDGVTSGAAHSGDFGLQFSDDFNLVSTAGLDFYPQQGDTFELFLNPVSHRVDSSIFRVQFATSNTTLDDGYRIQIEDTSWTFRRMDAGAVTGLASGTYTDITGTGWHRIEVLWDDGSKGGVAGDFTITIEPEGGAVLDTMTANDTTYVSGGVGFQNIQSWDDMRADDWTVLDRP